MDAKYTVLIPRHDNMGNPLSNVTEAAHDYLVYKLPGKFQGVYVDPGKWGHWEGSREEYDILVAHGEDTPENDSYIKQLGAYVGELANQEIIFATKTAKQVSTWPIRNSHYLAGFPAEAAEDWA